MATNSQRQIVFTFEGDVVYNQTFNAVQNAESPGMIEQKALVAGANTITVPEGATACTIIPSITNTVTMTLKGISGDTGISLGLTSPTSIALPTGASTFVITAGDDISLKLIWS